VDTAKAVVIASCWFSLTLIASVYMIVFAAKLGDIFFGVFLPIGLLVLVGLAVTFLVSNSREEKISDK
jgi:hypothetical protein